MNPRNEPVAIAFAIRMVLLAAISFGLHLTDAQFVALMAAIEAVIAVVVRQQVTPTALAQERMDAGQHPLKSRG